MVVKQKNLLFLFSYQELKTLDGDPPPISREAWLDSSQQTSDWIPSTISPITEGLLFLGWPLPSELRAHGGWRKEHVQLQELSSHFKSQFPQQQTKDDDAIWSIAC